MNDSTSPRRRLRPASLAPLALGLATLGVATLLAPASASAQSGACYKGFCSGLDTSSAGSNFGVLRVSSYPASPMVASGTSGGDVDVSTLATAPDGSCVGWATVLPDHILEVDAQTELRIAADSVRDVALVVHGPEGWRCNDDAVAGGTDPALEGRFGPGTYRIWVSSYSRGFFDYELSVSGRARPGRPGQGGGGGGARSLDASSTAAAHESVIYRPGSGEVALDGRAGGGIDASYLRDADGVACVGFTHREPDHIVTLTEHFDGLTFAARAAVDTTLVVHGPHGWRCNDDVSGHDPAITGSYPPGTYRVWVGSYDALDSGPYTFLIADAYGAYPPAPPQLPVEFSFRGRFESLDVAFSGSSPDEVYRECTAFASGSEALGWVDDIVIDGRSYRYGSGYWNAGQLCAIAALNARPSTGDQVGVRGTVEDVPFDVRCHGDEARRVLLEYLPLATEGLWIDDIVVDGTPYHNGPSFWSATAAAEIVASNVVDPFARLEAVGDIEGVPFRFAADSSAEIQRQCVAWVASAASDQWLDDLTVNGQARHNSGGWWTPTDACMIVGSLARER